MSDRVTHYFSFGQDHMTNYPLPYGGRLADYWVAVELPDTDVANHRQVFIDTFMEYHAPRPGAFSMEYDEARFNPIYFPNGELCRIDENGIRDNKS